MAILSKKSILRLFRGSIGKLVLRQHGGKTVVYPRPARSKKQATAGQTAHRQRFARAAAFARKQMQDPVANAHYKQLALLHNLPNAYVAALKYYMQHETELLKST